VLNPDHADHPPAVPLQGIQGGLIHAELLVKPEIESWQVALTAEETGFTNEESSPWSVTVVPDLPPFVQVIEPAQQLELLPDESIRVSAVATDDVGLASVKLAHQVNAGAWTEKEVSGKTGKESQVQATLPLVPMQVKAGDTVMLKLIATDLKGLKTESEPVRIVILEQTMSPQQREWAAQTRRFAQQAETLSEDAREMRKAVDQLRETEKQAEKNPEAARAAQDALARAQGDFEKVQSKAEDLWKQLQESARQAPTHLDAAEVQLLGERLAHMRADSLKTMEKEMASSTPPARPRQTLIASPALRVPLLPKTTRVLFPSKPSNWHVRRRFSQSSLCRPTVTLPSARSGRSSSAVPSRRQSLCVTRWSSLKLSWTAVSRTS
jgi:hypothetical protein